MLPLTEVLLVICIAGLTIVLVTMGLPTFWKRAALPEIQQPEPLALLFDQGVLHHGNDTALRAFSLAPGTHVWDDLRNLLSDRFPDFPHHADAAHDGPLTLFANDPAAPQQVSIGWRGDFCWVTLDKASAPTKAQPPLVPPTEFEALQATCDTAPGPVWHLDEVGALCWSNRAYDALHKSVLGAQANPAELLFKAADTSNPDRYPLESATPGKPDWYQVTKVNVGAVTIHHATCISSVVAAERAQRNFVQTLANSFAHLSTGLAIFDRKGQLVLFNPALVDLTCLSAQFLSVRPSIVSFFDQLRENRRMPEPKNYRTWRQEISDVIAKASDGQYRETWTLENGQTFTVTGRPHPDGATAFLIEDITAEVALTRNFRAELEQNQILLDSMHDGLVVFTASGVLSLSNAAYQKMWQHQPDSAFSDVTIADAIALWRGRSCDGPDWSEISCFVGHRGGRQTLSMAIDFDDSSAVQCTVSSLPSGATLVRFRPATERAGEYAEKGLISAD